jgi:hypothetical protein
MSDGTPDIEVSAREMGWRPKEEFQGEEAKWVDAQTFVSRGENFIPLLRKQREDLRAAKGDLEARLGETQRLLLASQEAIAELKAHHTENTAKQVEAARKSLIAQLATAREAGDVAAEIQIQDELADIREAKAVSNTPAPSPIPAPTPQVDPVFAAWEKDNMWFREKPRLRGLAMGIAEELKSDPETKGLSGKPFFDALTKAMEPYLNPSSQSRQQGKVDGGRPNGSGNNGSGSSRERSYSDLPAEAKQVCDRQAAKLVGLGRAFKDAASWQAYYVKDFFAGETA